MSTSGSILIVDSYPPLCILLREILIEAGYQVHSRPSNEVALELIQSLQPDLLILELRRQDVDATLLLLGQLRQHPATQPLPVLVSSTDARLLADLAEPLQHLNSHPLIKPFGLDQLLTYVMEALGGDRSGLESMQNEQVYAGGSVGL